MITIICITLALSVVLYGDWATEAKYSFVLFLKMGKLPLNKKTIAFEKKYKCYLWQLCHHVSRKDRFN